MLEPMMRHGQLLTVLVFLGCAVRSGSESPGPLHPAQPPPRATFEGQTDEFTQLQRRYATTRTIRSYSGKATYYSTSLAGHKMASGETYGPARAQAAHRTLPFGTVVRVTNLQASRSVIVRITDRGPYGKGRIIDLSHAAAERIGLIRAGVAEVRLDVLQMP